MALHLEYTHVGSICPAMSDDSKYCNCKPVEQDMSCDCGEEYDVHEWAWDNEAAASPTVLSKENREVKFHPSYSTGTAAVRGDKPFKTGRAYYWEVKMLTPLYGTDVMVGIGTKKANLTKSLYNFCSLLGSDKESWGYSYTGSLQHNGNWQEYGPTFCQGSIIGVHLDTWKGILKFYLNRKPLGVAFTSLQGQELYPMVCSTAAQSAMRVVYSFSCPSSLQLFCLDSIFKDSEMVKRLNAVPGLRAHVDKAYWWLLPGTPPEEKEDDHMDSDDDRPLILLNQKGLADRWKPIPKRRRFNTVQCGEHSEESSNSLRSARRSCGGQCHGRRLCLICDAFGLH